MQWTLSLYGHGRNKSAGADYSIDVRHKLVLDVTLDIQLRRWRTMQLPMRSIVDLYRLYEREMSHESAFCNWWSMWCLFEGEDRVDMLRRVSLVDPAFSHDMLETWYRKLACSRSSLDELDEQVPMQDGWSTQTVVEIESWLPTS